MASSELTPNDWAMDLQMQSNRLASIADEVSEHVAKGNLAGAALVLGLAHYKIDQYAGSVSGFLTHLREQGVTPDDGLKGA